VVVVLLLSVWLVVVAWLGVLCGLSSPSSGGGAVVVGGVAGDVGVGVAAVAVVVAVSVGGAAAACAAGDGAWLG